MQKSNLFIHIVVFAQISIMAPLFGMQLSQFQFGSASVLPVTYFTKKGVLVKYAILSREAAGNDRGTYDDFGGARDQGENHPIITAAREFSEEGITHRTFGMDHDAVRRYIDVDAGHTEHILAHTHSVTYITNFDSKAIVNFRKRFHGVLARETSAKYKEKDRIATVRWDLLEDAVRNARHNKGVTVQARLIDPATGNEEANYSIITLRPFLVKRLRPLVENSPSQAGKNPKIRFY